MTRVSRRQFGQWAALAAGAVSLGGCAPWERADPEHGLVFMPQYREPFKLRILQNMCDILEDDPQHSLGWTRWSRALRGFISWLRGRRGQRAAAGHAGEYLCAHGHLHI